MLQKLLNPVSGFWLYLLLAGGTGIMFNGCESFTSKRNIALNRAVYHSSAIDFNATGHLVTDGILTYFDYIAPVFTDQYGGNPQGETPEFAFDQDIFSKWLTFHSACWLQIHLPEGESVAVKKYSLTSGNDGAERDPKGWSLEGSNDGVNFTVLDSRKNEKFENRLQTKEYILAREANYCYYRLNIQSNHGDERTQLAEFDLHDADGISVIDRPLASEIFDSRWISKTAGEEWIYVDLGEVSKISEIILHWASTNYATAYEVQVSNDARNWQAVYNQTNGRGGTEARSISKKARYVRLVCRQSSGDVYSLVEMEVIGTNKIKHTLPPLPEPQADGTQYLRGGNWRLQRSSEVKGADRKALSQKDYDDKTWIPAKVPATVLTSYLEAGAIPDPNYGDQQLLISDSFFTADFWYRNHFVIPSSQKGKRIWLNFDAVNWKAEVYFNGEFLGRIDGAFIRGKFEITELANYGSDNYVAVLIHKNDTPGAVTLQDMDSPGKNGGVLGADNPTIHASVGWDWVPTIRGRNTGIYNDVYLSYSGDIQMSDPWIITDLDVDNKDFSKAVLTVNTGLSNASGTASTAIVKGVIQPGNLMFESRPVTLAANETRELSVTEDLILENPELWWPVTYGQQPLYTAQLTAVVDGVESDKKEFKFGIRKYTYNTEYPMAVYCNGTRIVCRGGNWGMDDSNLAATEEDYDIKVRMHAEANFTMIRNWVGMTGNEAFYRACDKYGVLIWDDFWLANPGDGPDPDDEQMFMQNAKDKIRRNRHHAALALYCGRNEGMPPKKLDEALSRATSELDGTRHYIPHSAAQTVSGFGPYTVQDSEWYFKNTGPALHSERGMPNIPSLESMKRMLPPQHYWPIDDVWGIHDFTMVGAQGGRNFLNKMDRYGEFNDLPAFVRTAQMVNYEGHKALFEAVYTNQSNGMLMWMSQSAWPSMVWQTYDYYYDTNAGYFGIKKANQPVNAIYNWHTNAIILCNSTGNPLDDAKTTVTVYNLQGIPVYTFTDISSLKEDSTKEITVLPEDSLSGLIFLKTTVEDSSGKQLSDNFTWLNVDEKYNYKQLSELPEAKLEAVVKEIENSKDGLRRYEVNVNNTGNIPALLVRIKTMKKGCDELVLPVYYHDNYFSLMNGEEKKIKFEFDAKYLNGKEAVFFIEGWNKKTEEIRK